MIRQNKNGALATIMRWVLMITWAFVWPQVFIDDAGAAGPTLFF